MTQNKKPKVTELQHHFFMWLHIDKGYDAKKYGALSKQEQEKLGEEFLDFMSRATVIDVRK